MTQISTTPGVDAPGEPRISVPPATLDAVRREFRRSRRSPGPERWPGGRLREQLPRVALYEALEILLGWRGEPRFEAGAVAWHARLAGHVPGLTLDDAAHALTALGELGGSTPEVGALALHAICEQYRLDNVTAVLGDWLEQRHSCGGF
jgi:hypothetical protein